VSGSDVIVTDDGDDVVDDGLMFGQSRGWVAVKFRQQLHNKRFKLINYYNYIQ
jgi:hypothetical protein